MPADITPKLPRFYPNGAPPPGDLEADAVQPCLDLTDVNIPHTSGGTSIPIDRLPLAQEHFSQKDKTMNKAIWALFPIDKTPQELTAIHAQAKDQIVEWVFAMTASPLTTSTMKGHSPSGDYNRDMLIKTIPIHERGRIAANLGTVERVTRTLAWHGIDDAFLVADMWRGLNKHMKETGMVEDLEPMIQRIIGDKDKANT